METRGYLTRPLLWPPSAYEAVTTRTHIPYASQDDRGIQVHSQMRTCLRARSTSRSAKQRKPQYNAQPALTRHCAVCLSFDSPRRWPGDRSAAKPGTAWDVGCKAAAHAHAHAQSRHPDSGAVGPHQCPLAALGERGRRQQMGTRTTSSFVRRAQERGEAEGQTRQADDSGRQRCSSSGTPI